MKRIRDFIKAVSLWNCSANHLADCFEKSAIEMERINKMSKCNKADVTSKETRYEPARASYTREEMMENAMRFLDYHFSERGADGNIIGKTPQWWSNLAVLTFFINVNFPHSKADVP